MQAPHSYTEVAEFIADVNPEHILNFKASKRAGERFEKLALEKKAGSLTDDEQEELAMHIHIEYLMSLAKAKARAKVQNA
ncbi:MAG: hypothetical protein ACE5I1_33285 [bacterium]